MSFLANLGTFGRFLVLAPLELLRKRNEAGWAVLRLFFRGGPRSFWRAVAYYYRAYVALRWKYARWLATYDTLTDSDRARIRAAVASLPFRPLISVVMPVYNPPLDHFRSAIESVRSQLYPDWELCIANDAATDDRVRAILDEYAATDPRIRVTHRDRNGHISAASNSALALATGEFVALLDQDDILAEHALYLIANEVCCHPDCDLIYSDEDKLSPHGRRFDPYFKPDWNWGLVRSQNMFSHLGAFRTALVRTVGGFREGYEGSQDYDLVLRCADASRPDRIRHVPHVLYHWRVVPGSTAGGGGAKDYAHRAGLRALQDHLLRRGLAAEAVDGPGPGLYRVRYTVPDPAPLVTVIVVADPGQHVRPLQMCQPAALDYPAVEWCMCGEQGQRTAWDAGAPAGNWISADGLNGAERLNRAAENARGEILCFLASELVSVSPGWLRTLVGHARQADAGAVGAKLVMGDGSVSHGGYLVTADVPTGDPNRGTPESAPGPFGVAVVTRDCQAVSGACLVVRKDAFRAVGGFDGEVFPGAFRDVDLCLRLADLGLRTVWTPDATLVWRGHGCDLTNKQTDAALQRFRERWAKRLQPEHFHSPNLRRPEFGFGLADPPPSSIHDIGRRSINEGASPTG